jgi:hypothetical protein
MREGSICGRVHITVSHRKIYLYYTNETNASEVDIYQIRKLVSWEEQEDAVRYL